MAEAFANWQMRAKLRAERRIALPALLCTYSKTKAEEDH
jgi:hypothetical protein